MSAPDSVRVAAVADLDALLAMEAQFPGDRMSRRSLRSFLANPGADFLVMDADGRPAGNLLLLSPARWRASRIYSLVVAPRFRGRGVAQALVRAAEARARARGRSAVVLEVRADNAAARGLYRGLGYAEQAQLPQYYDDGGDGLRLGRELGPS